MHDLLHAYFDGELDEGRGRAFEGHLATCPECARELAALRELRTALQDGALRFRPPPALGERIRASLPGDREPAA